MPHHSQASPSAQLIIPTDHLYVDGFSTDDPLNFAVATSHCVIIKATLTGTIGFLNNLPYSKLGILSSNSNVVIN